MCSRNFNLLYGLGCRRVEGEGKGKEGGKEKDFVPVVEIHKIYHVLWRKRRGGGAIEKLYSQ